MAASFDQLSAVPAVIIGCTAGVGKAGQGSSPLRNSQSRRPCICNRIQEPNHNNWCHWKALDNVELEHYQQEGLKYMCNMHKSSPNNNMNIATKNIQTLSDMLCWHVDVHGVAFVVVMVSPVVTAKWSSKIFRAATSSGSSLTMISVSSAYWRTGQRWSKATRVRLVKGQGWMEYVYPWISGYSYPRSVFVWMDEASHFSWMNIY